MNNTPLPIKDPVITKPISQLQPPINPLRNRGIPTFINSSGAIVDKSGNVYG